MILLPKEYLIVKGVVVTIEHVIEDYRKAKEDGDITWDEVLDGIKDIAKNLILGCFLGIDMPEEPTTGVQVSGPKPVVDKRFSKATIEMQLRFLEKMGIKLGPVATMAINMALSKWDSLSNEERIAAIDKTMDSVEGLFLDRPVLNQACKSVRKVLGVPDDDSTLGT